MSDPATRNQLKISAVKNNQLVAGLFIEKLGLVCRLTYSDRLISTTRFYTGSSAEMAKA